MAHQCCPLQFDSEAGIFESANEVPAVSRDQDPKAVPRHDARFGGGGSYE
jgi:hypothetical protein